MALKGVGDQEELDKRPSPFSVVLAVEEERRGWQLRELRHKPKSESDYSKSLENSW